MGFRSGAAGLLVPIALSLAACGAAEAPTDDGPGASDGLSEGRTFLSTSVTERDASRPLVDGSRIRLEFDDPDLRAYAGCNYLGGRASQDGDRLILDAMGGTVMGCRP